jgi:hypothetical protein
MKRRSASFTTAVNSDCSAAKTWLADRAIAAFGWIQRAYRAGMRMLFRVLAPGSGTAPTT